LFVRRRARRGLDRGGSVPPARRRRASTSGGGGDRVRAKAKPPVRDSIRSWRAGRTTTEETRGKKAA